MRQSAGLLWEAAYTPNKCSSSSLQLRAAKTCVLFISNQPSLLLFTDYVVYCMRCKRQTTGKMWANKTFQVDCLDYIKFSVRQKTVLSDNYVSNLMLVHLTAVQHPCLFNCVPAASQLSAYWRRESPGPLSSGTVTHSEALMAWLWRWPLLHHLFIRAKKVGERGSGFYQWQHQSSIYICLLE